MRCKSTRLSGSAAWYRRRRMVLAFLILLLARKRRQPRAYWVNPILQRRERLGEYHRLVQEMRMQSSTYFFTRMILELYLLELYFRMSPPVFDRLLSMVAPLITKKSTPMRMPLPAAERLAITLMFLVTGDSYQTIAFSYRCHKSTVAMIVPETCRAIWHVLQPTYMPPPSIGMWKRISRDYQHFWNFPNCLGSVDGKHVLMQAPASSGSLFYNYKKTFSIVLMAVVDACYRFIVVDVGAFGRQSDGSVFSNSMFGQRLINGQLDLPADEPLPGHAVALPHVFLGDEAFPLRTNLMRPFPGPALSDMKGIYNYRLSRARRTVENAFGIMSSRFRVFRRPLAITPSRADDVVKCCTVLHNFLRDESTYCGDQSVDYEDSQGVVQNGDWRGVGSSLRSLMRVGRRTARDAVLVRDQFAQYFISSAGSVSWQQNMV